MKWTRRISIILVVLAGLIAALWWEENWRGQKMWEESCARLRAAGEPVEIADIIPRMIPDEENVAAAPIFAEVMASGNVGTTRLGRISEDWVERVSKSGVSFPHPRPLSPSDLSFLDHWADTIRRTFPGTSPSGPFRNSADELVRYYAQLQGEWNELRDALKRPNCRWPLKYEDGLLVEAQHLACLQRLAVISRGWIAALAATGDDTAFAELLDCLFKLERTIGERPPTLISHLVAITMTMTTLRTWQDCLPMVNLADAQLHQLQTRLEQLTLLDVEQALRSERVIVLHSCSSGSAEQLLDILRAFGTRPRSDWARWSWVRSVDDTVFDTMFFARPRGWIQADLAGFQDALQSISSGCIDEKRNLLVAAKVDTMRDDAARLASRFGYFTFSRHTLEEPVSLQHRLLLRTAILHATVRCAMVWCAAERFRLKYGHFPRNQEALVPEFLHALLTDPIDGRPLHYVLKNPNNLLIYTEGWDGKDDGGVRGKRWEQEGDVGWASDPMSLVSLQERETWKEEDEERAERIAAIATPPRKPRKTRPGSGP